MADQSEYGRWFRQHARTLFGGDTKEATSGRKGDWLLFCCAIYPDVLPLLQEVEWQPGLRA